MCLICWCAMAVDAKKGQNLRRFTYGAFCNEGGHRSAKDGRADIACKLGAALRNSGCFKRFVS